VSDKVVGINSEGGVEVPPSAPFDGRARDAVTTKIVSRSLPGGGSSLGRRDDVGGIAESLCIRAVMTRPRATHGAEYCNHWRIRRDCSSLREAIASKVDV
jgi:hypothetical protein